MMNKDTLKHWNLSELARVYGWDMMIIFYLTIFAAYFSSVLHSEWITLLLLLTAMLWGSCPHIVKHQRSVAWWIAHGGGSRSWFAWNYLVQVLVYSFAGGISMLLVGVLSSLFNMEKNLGVNRVTIAIKKLMDGYFLYRCFLLFLFHIIGRSAIGLVYFSRTSALYPNWMRSLGMNESLSVWSVRDWLRLIGGTFYLFLLFFIPFVPSMWIRMNQHPYLFLSCILSISILYLSLAYVFATYAEYQQESSVRKGFFFQCEGDTKLSNFVRKPSQALALLRISPTRGVRMLAVFAPLFSLVVFGFLTYDALFLSPSFQDTGSVLTEHIFISTLLCAGIFLFFCFLLAGKDLLSWDQDQRKQAYLLTSGVSLRTLTRIRIGIGFLILTGAFVCSLILQYGGVIDQSWLLMLIVGLMLHRAGVLLFHYGDPLIVHPEPELTEGTLVSRLIRWIESGVSVFWYGVCGVVMIYIIFVLYFVRTGSIPESIWAPIPAFSWVLFVLSIPVLLAAALKAVWTLQSFDSLD